jgi:site-specific DNA-methyltransferase (adenine-specific)
METNSLYYGDNLDILRKHFPDNCVDLIYLDPPFNSKATYNVLFKEPTGNYSEAQMMAFGDTWHWGAQSEKALYEITNSNKTPVAIKELMSVLRTYLGKKNDMMAYLTMMCVRLIELKRVLKETGSIYLHCDLTAGHYLKVLMDALFGAQNFVNEIIWQRIRVTKAQTLGFGNVIDILLFYKKSDNFNFHPQYRQLDPKYITSHYKVDPVTGKTYRTVSMLQKGSGKAKRFGDKLLTPPEGRHWIWSQERIDQAMADGLIRFTNKGRPEKIQFLENVQKDIVDNLWIDISPINAQAKERLPYPTQKPQALLERIINASSNKGDIVLDPFCGCGTTLIEAQRLKRIWVGIDITHLAISVLKWRLEKLGVSRNSIKTIGEPIDILGARNLFEQDRYEFQYWVVDRIGGQPYGDKKKGADTGIDGFVYFMDEKDKIKKAIVSVKGGKNIHSNMIRDLGHVIDRENAEIGIFITLENPTKPMETEAIEKGFYNSPLGKSYPKIQIITVEDILKGKTLNIPPWIAPVQPPTTKIELPKSSRMI